MRITITGRNIELTPGIKEAVEEKGIEELMRIYVKFNREKEEDASLMEEARNWFVKMEQRKVQSTPIP